MATTLRAQVRLQNQSGLPIDVCMNTWHFRSTSFLPAPDVLTAHDALVAYYQGMQEYYSPVLGGPSITWYDLSDAEPRTPIFTDTFTWDVSGGTPLPNEVAITVSLTAAPESGVPIGRRRGRIFMGPFNIGVLSAGDFDARVIGDFLEDWQNVFDAFMDVVGSGDARLSVFSPTTAGAPPWSSGELDAATFPVVAAHVDNAFDTIRSRGVAASARTTWPVT